MLCYVFEPCDADKSSTVINNRNGADTFFAHKQDKFLHGITGFDRNRDFEFKVAYRCSHTFYFVGRRDAEFF